MPEFAELEPLVQRQEDAPVFRFRSRHEARPEAHDGPYGERSARVRAAAPLVAPPRPDVDEARAPGGVVHGIGGAVAERRI